MLENQTDSDKPIYIKEVLKGEQSNNKFKNIEKACSFWRVLWEGHNQRNAQVNSNTKADLVEEVREVMMLLFSGGKKAHVLQEGVARSFQATVHQPEFPLWFRGGKTNLIPKPGEFKSENHRPMTCLNTQYKWYTSLILLGQTNRNLKEYGLMQSDQRGAKEKCSDTIGNLLIDRMVLQDAQRGDGT